tara:strand:- start:50 stop:289 length:240 start_codon:yes stop_codon:yes gene_type:complete
MSNSEKYNNCFIESLSVDKKILNDDLEYNSIPEWDSIGHMTLMASLEEAFKISMDTNDIVDFSSYKKGKEILEKYKISF